MGRPILGDERYGGEEDQKLHLEAIKMSFPWKKGKDILTISI
ncbi:MAG: hypothetical protein ACI4S4_01955 [Candidatus Ornithospirochaeta sp.]